MREKAFSKIAIVGKRNTYIVITLYDPFCLKYGELNSHISTQLEI